MGGRLVSQTKLREVMQTLYTGVQIPQHFWTSYVIALLLFSLVLNYCDCSAFAILSVLGVVVGALKYLITKYADASSLACSKANAIILLS